MLPALLVVDLLILALAVYLPMSLANAVDSKLLNEQSERRAEIVRLEEVIQSLKVEKPKPVERVAAPKPQSRNWSKVRDLAEREAEEPVRQ